MQVVAIAAVLGGLFSLDLLVAFQFMVSRPLVAATITGLALGHPAAGLSFGCLMELIWMGALPVGSVVPPDFSLGAVIGSSAAIAMHEFGGGHTWETGTVWALLWSLPLASLGGLLEQGQRRLHGRLVQWAMTAFERGDGRALDKAVCASLGLSFLRGFIFTALCLGVCLEPMQLLLARVSAPAHLAFEWIYWLALMLGFVVLLDQFWERRWLMPSALSFVGAAVLIYGFGLNPEVVLCVAAVAALTAATIQERRSRA